MRVAEAVGPLELADYQKAVRLVLRHPLVTKVWPDAGALPLVRRWAEQLRADLPEALGYRLITTADTARLLRVQDELDATQPALTRGERPFDRRRYAYLVLTLAALGRSGAQIALGELADAVAADAARVDGLGMDTERKPDRDAFVDAVAWLEARGALRTADGSAAAWVNDPDRAEALYDIDREVTGALYRPRRVLQHLGSVTDLLDQDTPAGFAQGRETQRRTAARRARRLVLEQPAVYYDDVDEALRGQLRSPALAEDLERLTGLALERRAEGVALIDTSGRLSDLRFPAGGTVAQAALLLAARIAEQGAKPRTERLPAATAVERRAAAAARIDSALPERGLFAEIAEPAPAPVPETEGTESAEGDEASGPADEAAYPFVTDAWLRGAMKRLVATYGQGMSAELRDDPDRLTARAIALLGSLRLVAPVDGGVLALPLLGRYRGVTAQVKTRPKAAAAAPAAQPTLSDTAPGSEPGTATRSEDLTP
ncbi:TIGR02678 family protein [Actinacidiphila oryziradicis]|uniref:TIGR02678 family protein n=1 Tax=Actinacidiphila oryziradicis TaxID=2571141 RepID=A0A4V5N0G3_9ACTN|nr:TIGR02678 family protein [Actinacidiphila oryziradicis]TKA11929.1 TIGR02678 family protein [Actinacidiphila oryziradicis]